MGKMAKISPKIDNIEICPNQNSKTTFIVQTFPKYGPYDFYFMNLLLRVSVSRLSSYLKKQAYGPYKHARDHSCFFIFYYGQKFQDIKWL